jgi:hypothetical protein
MVSLDDSAWFLKAWLCSSHLSFLVIFEAFFLGISMGKFWGRFLEGFMWDVTYEDLVPLCLVILIQQTLQNGFDLGVFGGFHGKVFLRVDFRFFLID